jgi:hypothetical protein
MNERIQKLADQAQQYAEYNTPQGLEWLPMFKERFAELIVRECANIVQDSPWQLPQKYKSVDQANLIKKYFGVEE